MTAAFDFAAPRRRERLTPAQYVERFGPPRRRCSDCAHVKPDEHAAGGRLDRLVLADLAAKADWSAATWGEHAFPSVPAIAARIGYCERSVQYALRRLTRDGFLELDERPGRTNVCRIVRTVEPLSSVDNEPEPGDIAVDDLAPAAAEIGLVAPGGATVAPDRDYLPTARPPVAPDRGSEGNGDGASAPAHAPPRAARGQPPPSGSPPTSPAARRAEPHRRDAEAERSSAAAAAVPGDPDAALYGSLAAERVSRKVARRRPCPTCRAPAGEACRNRVGQLRVANHRARREGRAPDPGWRPRE